MLHQEFFKIKFTNYRFLVISYNELEVLLFI